MAYIDIEQFRTYVEASTLTQLSDDVEGAAEIPEVLEPIIDSASDMCDSYLSQRYAVPVASPGFALKEATARIAEYMLHLRRTWTVSEELDKAYSNAISWLKNIAIGKANLVEGSLLTGTSGSYFSADEQVFTSDSMAGFG